MSIDSVPQDAATGPAIPSAPIQEDSVVAPGAPAIQKSLEFTSTNSAAAKSAERLFAEGMQLFWQQEYKEAIQSLADAAHAAPEKAEYHYFLALSHRRSGGEDEAQKALARATDVEKGHSSPSLNRLLQRVQGKDRIWLEDVRQQAAN
jgi:tetratricopeptide (TPR) repeat protein